MKYYSAFIILIVISLQLIPLKQVQAALVPIEKTTKKVSKKTKKEKIKFSRKNLQKRSKNDRKKQLHKPNQQNSNWPFVAFLITMVCLYFSIPIVMFIMGLTLSIPGLWIAGICLFVLPFLTLLIIALINVLIQNASYEKRKRKEKLQKEK